MRASINYPEFIYKIAKLLFASLTIANAHPPLIEKELEDGRQSCKKIDGGKMEIAKDAVQTVDLNGDGKMDYILDYTKLDCPTAASMYSGSAGTLLQIYLTNPKGDLEVAWQDNVFSFEVKTVGNKRQIHFDGKGEGPEVIPSIYEARGVKLVKVEPPKAAPKKKK